MASMILRIGNRSTVNVTGYADASARYCEERDASDEGCSTFPKGCVMQSGRKIASVSYNGRVWKPVPDAWKALSNLLFDPTA